MVIPKKGCCSCCDEKRVYHMSTQMQRGVQKRGHGRTRTVVRDESERVISFFDSFNSILFFLIHLPSPSGFFHINKTVAE